VTQQTHTRHLNDTRTVLPVTLMQKDESGEDAAVDLTGLTVKFKLLDADNVEIVAETETGVTVVTASEGKVNYDFSAAGVNTAGRYYAYFLVYDGSESDHFPVAARDLVVCIQGDT
jgi:hypothetical protein